MKKAIRAFSVIQDCGMNEGIAPHPSPLPMGEGVRPQPLLGRPLSHGERDRVRGDSPVMEATIRLRGDDGETRRVRAL